MNKKPGTDSNSDDSQFNISEQLFNSALNQHLNTRAENLDYNVTHKLAAARRRVLDQTESSTSVDNEWSRLTAASVGALASVSALYFGVKLYAPGSLAPATDSTVVAQSTFIEDLSLLTASDDIDFFQSIEFLEWIESNPG